MLVDRTDRDSVDAAASRDAAASDPTASNLGARGQGQPPAERRSPSSGARDRLNLDLALESDPDARFPGPAEGGSTSSAVASIVALGAELGSRLDLVSPHPDPAMLGALRELVLSSDLDAATLRVGADEYERGDPRRVALVLASGWAAEHDVATDEWLLALAVDRETTSTGAEQESLAAILALDLAGREDAVEQSARAILEGALDESDEGFPGLTRIRAWFALEALDRFEGDRAELDQWLAATTQEHRIASELWALAGRTDPDGYADVAVERAVAGDAEARACIETLTGERHRARLTELVERSDTDEAAPWVARSAARALVADAAQDSRNALLGALERASINDRDYLLEALHTWREPAQPERAYASQLLLMAELSSDEQARERIATDLERRIEQWLVRRDGQAESRLLTALAEVEGQLASDDAAIELLNAWRAALAR